MKTYNRIARTIVEFETLYHIAWTKQIEASKAGLQATLIIRHPSNSKLYVNFDREILQLIRETKCLMRMGQEAPENAKMVLLQEQKFKSYYNKLSYALQQACSISLFQLLRIPETGHNSPLHSSSHHTSSNHKPNHITPHRTPHLTSPHLISPHLTTLHLPQLTKPFLTSLHLTHKHSTTQTRLHHTTPQPSTPHHT